MRDRPSGISLDDGHGRNGSRNHAASGHDRSTPDFHCGENNRTGTDKDIIINGDAFSATKVRDQHDAQANDHVPTNLDKVRAERLQDAIVADPGSFADLHPAPTMQADAPGACPGNTSREPLQTPVLQATEQILVQVRKWTSREDVRAATRCGRRISGIEEQALVDDERAMSHDTYLEKPLLSATAALISLEAIRRCVATIRSPRFPA